MAWLKEIATEAHSALEQFSACEKRLKKIAKEHEVMQQFIKEIGAVTLCTIWSTVGDPAKYTSSGAFLKALGLNLKELSSGKRNGQLAITKRGPGLARKLLFYWALRAIQTKEMRPWYQGFQRVGRSGSGSAEHRKMKGLVAAMQALQIPVVRSPA